MGSGTADRTSALSSSGRVGATLYRHLVALPRGVALAGLAAAGLVAGLLNFFALALVAVGAVPLHLAVVRASRGLVNLCRRLARDWGGVTVAEPYRPGPPAPERRPDGWYVHNATLYKSPRIPRMLVRMRWLRDDPATARDFAWMVLNPIVGGVLALLSPALVAAGAAVVAAPWSGWFGDVPAPLAGALGLVAVVLGTAVAPATMRLHARWTRLLLAPTERSCAESTVSTWVRPRNRAVGRGVALFALSLAGLSALSAHVVGYLVAWGWGMPHIVTRGRRLTGLYRRLAGDWAGVEIDDPYTPPPAAPGPGPDGTYRHGRRLHYSRDAVVRAQRLTWVARDSATWRDLAWMLTAPVVGAILLPPAALVVYGFFGLIWQPLWWPLWGPAVLLFGDTWVSPWHLWDPVAALVPALQPVPGAVSPAIGALMVLLGLLAAPPALRLHASWSRILLRPTEQARLIQRVRRLTETRADAVDTQEAELRRIERDLHDGAQARLVAMGMKIGAVEQLVDADPAAAKALLAQVREGSAEALTELRDLVRGIHPPVLSERGLGDAVHALALDSSLPVKVTADLPSRLDSPVESAAYFAVSELLTNVVRHSDASHASVDLRYGGGLLRVTVTDDGWGGASAGHAGGSGLGGIQRRLGTFDGVIALDSPPGGPTTVTMEIPCVPSSPRISTSSGTA